MVVSSLDAEYAIPLSSNDGRPRNTKRFQSTNRAKRTKTFDTLEFPRGHPPQYCPSDMVLKSRRSDGIHCSHHSLVECERKVLQNWYEWMVTLESYPEVLHHHSKPCCRILCWYRWTVSPHIPARRINTQAVSTLWSRGALHRASSRFTQDGIMYLTYGPYFRLNPTHSLAATTPGSLRRVSRSQSRLVHALISTDDFEQCGGYQKSAVLVEKLIGFGFGLFDLGRFVAEICSLFVFCPAVHLYVHLLGCSRVPRHPCMFESILQMLVHLIHRVYFTSNDVANASQSAGAILVCSILTALGHQSAPSSLTCPIHFLALCIFDLFKNLHYFHCETPVNLRLPRKRCLRSLSMLLMHSTFGDIRTLFEHDKKMYWSSP